MAQTEQDPTEITTEFENVDDTATQSPVALVKDILKSVGVNPNSMSGLFTTQKEPLQDLHVIKTWVPVNEDGSINQNIVRFVTRVMNPFQLSVLQTVIRELNGHWEQRGTVQQWIEGEDPPSGMLLLNFVNEYLINMIPFEGRRVLEQTEGLRARKQSEEQGLDLGKSKNAKSFLLGEKSTV